MPGSSRPTSVSKISVVPQIPPLQLEQPQWSAAMTATNKNMKNTTELIRVVDSSIKGGRDGASDNRKRVVLKETATTPQDGMMS